MKNNKYVYHYCSIDTLKKIIKNQTLRFTDVSESNDSDELFFICKLYENYLKITGKYNFLAKGTASYFLNENNCNIRHFCLCFSKNNDDLNMWRGYAPNGGVSLCFDKEELIKYFQKQ